jgi:4-amino-4-deoxy-L-arabinose transferase-like glycosyltransferase
MQPVQTEPEPRSGRFPLGLALVTLVGAIWRLGVLAFDKWDQPLLLNDSIYYSAQARQLVDGIWFREIFVDRPGAEHGPLTSVLLATVSWVDDPVPWQRLVTALCGIATIVVIGLLGRRIGGERVGLVAAALAAVYPNLWMNDGLVMSESVSVLVVSLALWAAHRLLTDVAGRTAGAEGRFGWPTGGSGRAAVVAGVLAGLAALARSELALLTPAVMLLVAVRLMRGRPSDVSWRRSLVLPLVVGLSSLATVAPWVVFNMVRFEETVTLTTNDGTTLLGSYCDASFSGPNIGGWSLLCVVADPDYAMDEEPSVRSARQRDLAIDYAGEHVGDLPKVVAARVGRTLDLYGLDSLVAQDVGEERYRWASWAGIVMWWMLGIAAVVGGVVLRRRTAPASWPLWLLLCPVASVTITTVVFYGGHRIRSSMEPTVIVLASLALVALVEHRRGVTGPDTRGDRG